VIGFDHECFENKLYINSGDGTFTDQTAFYNLDVIGCSLAATTSDLDWDGDSDIIVANDFGKWLEPNQLFQNEGANTPFSDISSTSYTNAQMYAMGIAVGDYDEDLDLDFYVTNIGENAFFVNEGNMNFHNQAVELDIDNTNTSDGLHTTGWGAVLEDFNNDSFLDLFVSNGYVYSVVDVDSPDQPDELFLGTPEHTFTNVTQNCGIDFKGTSRGALYGDWNMDGQLDLMTITNEPYEGNLNSINYYINQSESANWVGFRLKGTISNSDAYGSKIILHSGERALLRELRGGDSHGSQNCSLIHFGLGNVSKVDSIQIFWPSGLIETHKEIEINMYHMITEGLVSSTSKPTSEINLKVYPNPARDFLNIEMNSKTNLPAKVKIFNSMGKLVHALPIKNSMNHIDLSNFPEGLYTLVCSTSTEIFTTSIIKF